MAAGVAAEGTPDAHRSQKQFAKILRTESIFPHEGGKLKAELITMQKAKSDVAEDIKMHESTVSRATTNKWVSTPQGLFELKFFFNSPINTTDGESIASESVKEQIRKIIKSEEARKPYSDQEIAEMLNKMGIDAARRTVAKYRETMGILTSRHRKQRY